MPSRPDPRRHSLQRKLFTAQASASATSLPSLSAMLLAQASWRTLSFIYEAEAPEAPSPHDCYPIIFHDGDTFNLELLHHPSAATVAWLPNLGVPDWVDYRPSDACVGISLSWQGSPAILFSPLFEEPTRLWAVGGLGGRHVRGVSLAPAGPALAASIGPDVVFYAAGPGDAFMSERRRLTDPAKAQVAVARYAGEGTLLSGTSTGQLHCWDLRIGGRPVWSVDPSGARVYIKDIRVGQVSGDVYVSSELAEKNSLAAWDMRMGGAQGPKRSFWRDSWGETIAFDVAEHTGLIAAGGSDEMVSLWDCCKGGEPIQRMSIGEHVKRVRLMGFSGEGKGERPGLFVRGEYDVYVFEVGSRDG